MAVEKPLLLIASNGLPRKNGRQNQSTPGFYVSNSGFKEIGPPYSTQKHNVNRSGLSFSEESNNSGQDS